MSQAHTVTPEKSYKGPGQEVMGAVERSSLWSLLGPSEQKQRTEAMDSMPLGKIIIYKSIPLSIKTELILTIEFQ